ncbi:hypothetical protein [Paenibacillus amylolyticus]|uniref:hypothetical protein n=1 Tax=Paenibacillus amylolyticus TaxID=1451 RepID=UPI000A91832B|nr:hypothetical protein [Paenibacillus amylolyticus]
MSMNGQGIRGLLGREVKVNRGAEAVQGKLIDVRGDYMAVSCKKGCVYVNGLNVKSITDTGRSSGSSTPMNNPIPSNSFLEVVQALRFRRVLINEGSRDEVEGILAEANQNQLIITTDRQEVVRIPTYHVKSICIVRGGNKSSGNKSCGKPSHPNKSTGQKCCEKHPHKSTGHKCCEKHPHKSTGQKCCEKHPHKSTGHKCCEKHPHKSTGHKCCEKHPHKSTGQKCCEKHPHKSTGHKCCEKHPHKSTGQKCCEKHPHKSTGYISGRRK